MAEFSRVTSEGWEHGDDADTFSRVTSEGWQHQVGVAVGAEANPWYFFANEAIVQ